MLCCGPTTRVDVKCMDGWMDGWMDNQESDRPTPAEGRRVMYKSMEVCVYASRRRKSGKDEKSIQRCTAEYGVVEVKSERMSQSSMSEEGRDQGYRGC